MTLDSKFIKIGKILSPHGVKGQLKIFLSPSFEKNDKVQYFDSEGNKLDIKIGNFAKNNVYIGSISSISERSEAEKYIKKEIYILKELLNQKSSDEFYYYELEGLDVFSEKNEKLGQITQIYNFGSGDIIEIEFLDNSKEMFPFRKDIFLEINKDHVILKKPDII